MQPETAKTSFFEAFDNDSSLREVSPYEKDRSIMLDYIDVLCQAHYFLFLILLINASFTASRVQSCICKRQS